MNNLRKFNWITQYNSAKEGEELVKPSVSLVIDKAVVIYDDDIRPIYRWINLDPSEDYICDMEQHIKYYKQKKQVSLDNGVTWNDVVPAEYRRGDKYEEKSTDCGYIPTKLTSTFTDGLTYTKMYDGNPELTSGDTNFSGESKYEMTEAIIGDCVTSIGSDAFKVHSGLTSVVIPNSVVSIGRLSFGGCYGITSVTIPNSVTTIDEYAFQICSGLTSIDIPDSVTSIGKSAFQSCSGATNVTIGSGVTSIGNTAFGWCYSLTSVTINATNPPNIGSGVFDYGSDFYLLYVPDNSVNAYKTASGWSKYASRIKPMSEKLS